LLKRPGFLAVLNLEPPDEDAPGPRLPGVMLPALPRARSWSGCGDRGTKVPSNPGASQRATLVKALERTHRRPSTYATILSVLTDSYYVERL